MPTKFFFDGGALRGDPPKSLNEAPEVALAFSRDRSDDVDRLHILRIGELRAVLPVEGINVRADIVDVELLTKRVAVFFKKLRIGFKNILS